MLTSEELLYTELKRCYDFLYLNYKLRGKLLACNILRSDYEASQKYYNHKAVNAEDFQLTYNIVEEHINKKIFTV